MKKAVKITTRWLEAKASSRDHVPANELNVLKVAMNYEQLMPL